MAHKNEKMINDLCIKLSEVQKENRELKEKNNQLREKTESLRMEILKMKDKYEKEENLFYKMKRDKELLRSLGV